MPCSCLKNYSHLIRLYQNLPQFCGVLLCLDLDDEISYILYTEVMSKCFRMPIWLKKTLSPHVNDEQLNNAYLAFVMS